MGIQDSINSIKNLLMQVDTSIGGIKSEIHKLDDQIEAKCEERSSIIHQPLSKEDFMTMMAREIDDGANVFAKKLAEGLKPGSSMTFFDRQHEQGYCRSNVLFNSDEWVFHYHKQALLDGVEKAVSEHWEFPNKVMPVAERRVKIAKLDKEIASLEKQRDELANQLRELIETA